MYLYFQKGKKSAVVEKKYILKSGKADSKTTKSAIK